MSDTTAKARREDKRARDDAQGEAGGIRNEPGVVLAASRLRRTVHAERREIRSALKRVNLFSSASDRVSFASRASIRPVMISICRSTVTMTC